jgi:hypothetical protein
MEKATYFAKLFGIEKNLKDDLTKQLLVRTTSDVVELVF